MTQLLIIDPTATQIGEWVIVSTGVCGAFMIVWKVVAVVRGDTVSRTEFMAFKETISAQIHDMKQMFDKQSEEFGEFRREMMANSESRYDKLNDKLGELTNAINKWHNRRE